MEFNPFEATEKNGKLYGRGASDMKSAIAAFVSAVREYLENNEMNGTISLLITNDEEGPAINGTRKVLEEIYKNGEKIDSCLVGEPTCPSNLGEMIKIGRRGSITTTIKVSGKQGHVAYPEWTLNPINPLTSILNTLCNLELDKGTEDFPPSNMEIVKIESSEGATNIVPQTSTGIFNIRGFFQNGYDLVRSSYDKRSINAYGAGCGGLSYGFTKQIINKHIKNKKVKIINFSVKPPVASLFHEIKVDNSLGNIILLNVEDIKKSKINIDKYDLIEKLDNCYFYKKK